jgi:hypothetical protein
VLIKDYIEKYEFEVDDLMPHRLRQIRINFNFNEDLAWECDINKIGLKNSRESVLFVRYANA